MSEKALIQGVVAVLLAVLFAVFFRQRRRLGGANAGFPAVTVGLLVVSIVNAIRSVGGLAGVDTVPKPMLDLTEAGALIAVAAGVVIWLPTVMRVGDSARRAEIAGEISDRIARKTGNAYHQALIVELAAALDAEKAFIGLLSEDGTRVETIAAAGRDGPQENFSYPRAGSPCDGVLAGKTSVWRRGVADAFPDDRPLRAAGIEGYAGNALIGADGRQLGLLAVLTKRPIGDEPLVRMLVQVFSDRAAVELERDRALAALEQRTELLEEAEAIGRTGHWRTTDDPDVIDWSDSLHALFDTGRTGPATVTELLDMMPPGERERYAAFRKKAMTSGLPFETDVRVRRPDGSDGWMAFIGRPDADWTPERPRYRGIVQDITERKAVEAQLLDAQSARTQFVAVMNHELRTPLNPIIGFSQLLADNDAVSSDPNRVREYARRIGTAGQTMYDMVTDILDMMGLALDKSEFALVTTELGPVVRSAADHMRPRMDEAGLVFDVAVDPLAPPVPVDPKRVRQVMLHLLGNAVKFTPSGGRVSLALAASRTAGDDAPAAAISIRDTGIGMAADDVRAATEPFRRKGDGWLNHGGGLGLGLAISKSLAESHGGTLAIDSAAGRGTTVTVRFPGGSKLVGTSAQ